MRVVFAEDFAHYTRGFDGFAVVDQAHVFHGV